MCVHRSGQSEPAAASDSGVIFHVPAQARAMQSADTERRASSSSSLDSDADDVTMTPVTSAWQQFVDMSSSDSEDDADGQDDVDGARSVSYTHLTLPTKRIV